MAPKVFGLDDVGAGRRGSRAWIVADDVGPREDQVLVAALELGAAEVLGGEVLRLEPRAHRAVEDEDALARSSSSASARSCWPGRSGSLP